MQWRRNSRYLAPDDHNSNISRRAEHVFWTRARGELLAGIACTGLKPSAIEPGRKITGRRSVVKETYRQLSTGLAAAYAAAHGLEGSAAEGIAAKIATDIGREIAQDLSRFHKRVRRASDRMALIEDCYQTRSIYASVCKRGGD
jgi:hypothetical protein